MVDVVNTNLNVNKQPYVAPFDMNGRKIDVGVVSAPNQKLKKYKFYDAKEASRTIRKIDHDLYVKKKKRTFERRQETPKAVLFLFGAAVAAFSFYKFKLGPKLMQIFSRLKKN